MSPDDNDDATPSYPVILRQPNPTCRAKMYALSFLNSVVSPHTRLLNTARPRPPRTMTSGGTMELWLPRKKCLRVCAQFDSERGPALTPQQRPNAHVRRDTNPPEEQDVEERDPSPRPPSLLSRLLSAVARFFDVIYKAISHWFKKPVFRLILFALTLFGSVLWRTIHIERSMYRRKSLRDGTERIQHECTLFRICEAGRSR